MIASERHALVALIASPCLLKQDRAGRALFVSDFNRRAQDPQAIRQRLSSAGYTCYEEGGLTLIDWTPEGYAACYNSLPELPLPPLSEQNARLWGLCRLLLEHPAPLEQQDMAVLAQALRWLKLKQVDQLYLLISTSFALALRQGLPPPYHASKLLTAHLSGRFEESSGR